LVAHLWQDITRRAQRPPEHRPDASVVLDEAHNFLSLPIGMDAALAEARGYRVSLVLAHQHLGQLPADIADAIDANARNKILFEVRPDDARHLARHIRPLGEYDLTYRPAHEIVVRVLAEGRTLPAATLHTRPLPPAPPGRAEILRAAARRHASPDTANAAVDNGQHDSPRLARPARTQEGAHLRDYLTGTSRPTTGPAVGPGTRPTALVDNHRHDRRGTGGGSGRDSVGDSGSDPGGGL
jgi:hypothetical protein